MIFFIDHTYALSAKSCCAEFLNTDYLQVYYIAANITKGTLYICSTAKSLLFTSNIYTDSEIKAIFIRLATLLQLKALMCSSHCSMSDSQILWNPMILL